MYNIIIRYQLSLLAIFFLSTPVIGQSVSAYGVPVWKDAKKYREVARADSNHRMVNLAKAIPGLQFDLRYASENNFTGKKLYPGKPATSYLRLPAARALAKVQESLMKRGYALKVFDAYRPYSATVVMWELVRDERYAANPAKGSGHNRGLAIDLTIIDTRNGKELAMGTGFDNFTDSAHHSFTNLPQEVILNRKLLREVMESNGFKALETEWWHYYWPNDGNYPIMDVGFGKLH